MFLSQDKVVNKAPKKMKTNGKEMRHLLFIVSGLKGGGDSIGREHLQLKLWCTDAYLQLIDVL